MKKINTLIFTLSLVISAVGQNVGIGTVSPTSKLTVNGSQAIWNNNALTFFVDTGLSQKGYVGIAPSGGMTDLLLNSTANGGWLRIGANDGPIQFYPNGNADVSSAYGVVGIYPSGNMGIGVNNPTYKLDVAGNGRFNAGGPTFVYVGPNGGGYYGDATNLLTQIPTGGNFYMANNGIDGTRVAQADGSMRVGGPNQASANLYVYGGNVGIGTASPAHKLEVIGEVKADTFLMTTGAAAGYLMQSDATGKASWVSAATASDNLYNNSGSLTANRTVTMGADSLTFTSTTGHVILSQDAYIDSLTVGAGGGGLSTNAALGTAALKANTTGLYNVAIGYHALDLNTTGGINIAIGPYALHSGTSASDNIALGNNALYANTSGGSNIALGAYSLYSTTSGEDDIAIGVNTLRYNTTGSGNTGSGSAALYDNTSGQDNTATGLSALGTNTSGNNNTAMGYDALENNTTGGQNTAIGESSGGGNASGSYNTFIGYSTACLNGNQTNATAIGAYSYVAQSNSLILGSINGYSGATATVNVGIGTAAPLYRLHLITSGNTDGIIIQSTGSGSAPNLYFATYADVTAGVSHPGARIAAVDDDWSADITFSTKVPGADANAMTERMRLLNNGNVGIGTSTPSCLMDVEGNTNNSGTVTGAAGYVGYFKNGGTSNSGAILVNIASNVNSCRYMECEVNGSEVGCLYGNGSNALNVYSASDRRLKKNIRNTTMGIGEIMQIPVRDYEWNADGTTVSAGFIAQELYKIYPGAVLKGGEGDLSSQPGTTWMVNYASLTPLIVKSIQDQQHIIEDQKVEIEQLRKEISELRSSSASPADIDKLKASVETLQQMMQIKAQK